MTENLINLFFNGFALLIILVAQILIISTSRKNILLGIKIPEEKIKTEQVQKAIKGYKKENLLVGIPALIILCIPIYYTTNANAIMFSIFGYMGILFLVYLRWNKKVRELKVDEGWSELSKKVLIVDTNFSRDRGKNSTLSMKWYLIPLAIVLINIVISIYMYPSLPDSIAIHWDVRGNIERYMEKSVFVALLMPVIQLIMFIVFLGSNKFMLNTKQQINPRNPQQSIKNNIMYRRVWSIYFLLVLILMEILFTALNFGILGLLSNMKVVNFFSLIITVFIVISSGVIGIKLGQGGDRLKISSESDSRGYEVDDDDLWKLGGIVYYNPNDSSLFVEKRVGIGWTVNAATPLGLIITILPVMLIIVLIIFID